MSGRAPHTSHVDPAFGTTAACAGCHQVDAPSRPGVPLQDTVGEWRAAGEPGGSCQSCHMPARGGGHRHDAPGGRDREMLARALTVDASAHRDGWDTVVSVTLTADGAGHAVPTGDVFRRVIVRAWDPARPDVLRSIELGRSFRQGAVLDERVPPPGRGSRTVSLRIPSHAREILWAVEIWPLPQDRVAHAGVDVAGRMMAEGRSEVTR